MAEETDINSVKLQIPDSSDTLFGLDDVMIATLLDSGLSVTATILSAWRAIAAKTATITDIAESGSSRNMSIIGQNAQKQVAYWQQMKDREDNAAGTEQIVHAITTPITRV